MAGAAASETILFVGALVAGAVVAAGFGAVTIKYVESLRARTNVLDDELQGRIAIVNDPALVPNSPLTLYVKNTGTRDQTISSFVVLTDGTLRSTWTATVNGASTTTLGVRQVATITLTGVTLAAGDHVATVVSDSGYAASLDFTV